MSLTWQPKNEADFERRVSFAIRGGWVPVLQWWTIIAAGASLALAIIVIGW